MIITVLRVLVSYAAAIVTAAVLACAAATQFMLAGLGNFGMQVTLSDRWSATLHDIVGMGPPYMMFLSVGFLIAFTVTAILLRWVPGSRSAWYSAAGAVAIVAILMMIKYSLGGTVVGAARTLFGLAVQALAGGAGGWLFARLLPRKKAV